MSEPLNTMPHPPRPHPSRLLPLLLYLCSSVFVCGFTPSCSKPAAPPSTAPGVGQTFRLSQAVVLDTVPVPTRGRIILSHQLLPPLVDSPVLFGTLKTQTGAVEEPLLLGRVGSQWRAIELKNLPGYEWVHATYSESRKEIFGILDLLAPKAEDRAPALLVVMSSDGGANWTVISSVTKPHRAARFESFALAADGKGRLTMTLDYADSQTNHGYHHFRTTDAGQTWSPAELEPDDFTDAETLPPPPDGTTGFDHLDRLLRAATPR